MIWREKDEELREKDEELKKSKRKPQLVFFVSGHISNTIYKHIHTLQTHINLYTQDVIYI